MMINKKILIALCALAIFAGVVIVASRYFSKPQNDKLCQGTVVYELKLKDTAYSYRLTHIIYISDHNVGYDALRGQLTAEGKTYIINRTINFTYKNLKDGRLEAIPTFVYKTPQDNVSDELTQKYFRFLTEGAINYFRMEAIDNEKALVTANTGKFFICSYL